MWDPTLPGVNEARYDAIRDTLVANLASLNTTLQRGGIWPEALEITANMIVIGDPATAPDWKDAPIFITIDGEDDDCEITFRTMESSHTNGTYHEFETIIMIYPHPMALPFVNSVTTRERVLARAVDWATDGVLNAKANQKITMASRVYHAAPAFDYLTGIVERVEKDWFAKSFGKHSRVRAARLTHKGKVG
jgi:hypothetical protein